MQPLEPVTLTGKQAMLVPLSLEHLTPLKEAILDGMLWQLWYTNIPAPDEMEGEIRRRLALQSARTMLPFTVIDAQSGQAAGMTTFMDIDLANDRLEIGSTWYAARFQRTAFNTECKLLLLRHAFEILGCIAVEFRTHFFNHQSRRAIERLGAKLDGVLRHHRRLKNGTIRDTCVYSITQEEWPSVSTHLEWQLTRPR